MNTVIKLIIVGLWLGSSMACSQQEDIFEKNVDTRSLPIEISMRSLTRGSSDVIYDLDTMGVFRTSSGGYEVLNNARYTFYASGDNAGKWLSDDVSDARKTIYMDHRIGKLFALYPYQAGLINGTVLTMEGLKRYSEQNNSCLSELTRASNDIIAGFTVKPIYSRLSLLLKNIHTTKSCIIKNVTITSTAGFVNNATLEMSTENRVLDLTQSQKVNVYKFPLNDTDIISGQGILPSQVDETVDMIWIPQPLNGMHIEITFSWSGETNEHTAQIDVPKAILSELKMATHHQLKLNIKAL